MSCPLQDRSWGWALHEPGFTTGVQTPDTPPPPGDSLIPITSVFPVGRLRGPLKPAHLLTLWSHSFRFWAQLGPIHPAPGKNSWPQADLEEWRRKHFGLHFIQQIQWKGRHLGWRAKGTKWSHSYPLLTLFPPGGWGQCQLTGQPFSLLLPLCSWDASPIVSPWSSPLVWMSLTFSL